MRRLQSSLLSITLAGFLTILIGVNISHAETGAWKIGSLFSGGMFQGGNIEPLWITNAKLHADSVDGSKIAPNAVTSLKTDGTIQHTILVNSACRYGVNEIKTDGTIVCAIPDETVTWTWTTPVNCAYKSVITAGSCYDDGDGNTVCNPDYCTYDITTPASGGWSCTVTQWQYDATESCFAPLDCTYSTYSSCSATCGGGTTNIYYNITSPAQHGWKCAVTQGQYAWTTWQSCNTFSCTCTIPDELTLYDGMDSFYFSISSMPSESAYSASSNTSYYQGWLRTSDWCGSVAQNWAIIANEYNAHTTWMGNQAYSITDTLSCWNGQVSFTSNYMIQGSSGTAASCTIFKWNGRCGISNGTMMFPSFNNNPQYLCSAGIASTPVLAWSMWTWNCNGVHGGAADSCSAPVAAPTYTDWLCGSADGVYSASMPSSNLCAQGTLVWPSSYINSNWKQQWTWTCKWTMYNASCWTPDTSYAGSCGTSSTRYLSALPTTGLCVQGSLKNSVQNQASQYYWECWNWPYWQACAAPKK